MYRGSMMKCVIEVALLVVFAVAGVGAYLTTLRGRRLAIPEQTLSAQRARYTLKGNAYRNASFRFAAVALLSLAAFTAVTLMWGGTCWPVR